MKTKFFLIPLILLSLVILLLSALRSPAQAAILDDIKAFFSKDQNDPSNKKFTIDTDIVLAPGGDISSNNQIDAGDIIRFTYTIKNTTDKSYTYATLKTNIDRKQLSFIHGLRGATGLSDGDGTINFHNVRINPHEQRIINFNARAIYSREDKTIDTEPEFITSDKYSVVKAQKKHVLAKKLSEETLQKLIENRKAIKILKK